MPPPAFWFLVLFSAVTILMVALSVPLMFGWVRPNALYGVRTPRTLSDERLWYESNALGGRVLFVSGLVELASILLLFAIPRLRADFVAYNLACGAVILGGTLAASALILRRIR